MITTLLKFILFFDLNSAAYAKPCSSQSAAADYKCRIKNSQNTADLKFRYNRFKHKSASLEFRENTQDAYAEEFFIVKIDPVKDKYNWKNCMLFGLIGKCVRQSIKLCDSNLKVSHSETYGLLNRYKYKRVLTLNTKNKSGSYTYLRRTPKASPSYRLKSFKVELEKCSLITKY